ncbi:MAG: stage II sporulation protein R [Oscillospiraceae bacterium]|nr:stage II sporulation protein R [Oscillospiraceae bacterium]
MKKRTIHMVLVLLCAVFLVTMTVFSHQQRQLSEKLIRLHVVANSDTQEDQAIKLRVRDAVLLEAEQIMKTADEPRQALQENLDKIHMAATRCLMNLSRSDTVTVRLGKELFPTRAYETFSLPAGVYESLRVSIGTGSGHNWWCVVFPSICLPAGSDDFSAAAQTAGMTAREICLITETSPQYEIKFKTIELLQELKNFLTDMN